MDLKELDAARIELVGDEFGSKGKFARLLGLSGHHSLRGYFRRGKVPKWIETRILDLLELRELRLAKEARKTRARARHVEKRQADIFAASPLPTDEEII
ncbi:hypothetical protein [Leclercia adecarboxylata]|uniref:hypothetical protein n=1 Tax=Leclercia adecarboxylata TaxID=83655 RepID=UPI003D95F473